MTVEIRAAQVSVGDELIFKEKVDTRVEDRWRTIGARVYEIYEFKGRLYFRTRSCTVSCEPMQFVEVRRS